MSLIQPIQNIINLKINSIIKDLNKELRINNKDISDFITSKYDFIKINNIDTKSNDLIKDKLLDYLNNDPKFLYFNKTLLDIVETLKFYSKKKELDDSYITEDYVNDILISFLNHKV